MTEDGYLTEEGFVISSLRRRDAGDMSKRWILEGRFEFEDADHLKEFNEELARFFNEVLGIWPVEIVAIEAYRLRGKIECEQGTLPIRNPEETSSDNQGGLEVQATAEAIPLDERLKPGH